MPANDEATSAYIVPRRRSALTSQASQPTFCPKTFRRRRRGAAHALASPPRSSVRVKRRTPTYSPSRSAAASSASPSPSASRRACARGPRSPSGLEHYRVMRLVAAMLAERTAPTFTMEPSAHACPEPEPLAVNLHQDCRVERRLVRNAQVVRGSEQVGAASEARTRDASKGVAPSPLPPPARAVLGVLAPLPAAAPLLGRAAPPAPLRRRSLRSPARRPLPAPASTSSSSSSAYRRGDRPGTSSDAALRGDSPASSSARLASGSTRPVPAARACAASAPGAAAGADLRLCACTGAQRATVHG